MNSTTFNRSGLAAWVKEQFAGQVIRKTVVPYFDHLVFVGEKAGAVISLGYEIGLCHDLIEKTPCTASNLHEALVCLGYHSLSAEHITKCVVELTDVFTKSAFPHLNKKERKQLEANRLAFINSDAQTVKYADLIYNINWMLQNYQARVLEYLAVKRQLLETMHDGDKILRREALSLIDNAKSKTLNAKQN